MRRLLYLISLLGCGILVTATSCGRSGPVKDSVTPANRVAQTSEGAKSNGQSTRPSSMPSDIPFYPGGRVDSEVSEGSNHSITYTAPVAFNTAFDYYETEFKRMGWEVRQRAGATDPAVAKAAGGVRINAQKEMDTRLVTCYVKIVPQTDGECSVNLVFPKELQGK